MEVYHEEEMASKHLVSLKVCFLLEGSFKIMIFPFSPVSGLFSYEYILKKGIWASFVSRKSHSTR